MTDDLVTLLGEFYTDAEAFQWLIRQQPLFDGAVPLDIVAEGRMGDLVLALRGMRDGVYT